ncbi:hypothetical protein ACRYCC_03340 [Actinomadura scrupuli]|uniref:hypothetical protein n=1 Tax=Actinomadura scrupuli TaxID=559629 RepID=UPI003D97B581
MTWLMALETSSRNYSVALGTGSSPEVFLERSRRDPAFDGIAGMARELAEAQGVSLRDLGSIAVNAGPGDRISVRAGISYANALAYSLGINVRAVDGLELMALEAAPGRDQAVISLRKAGGADVYGAISRPGEDLRYRYGAISEVVPALVRGCDRVLVAGSYDAAEVGRFAEVEFADSSVVVSSARTLFRRIQGEAVGAAPVTSSVSPVTEEAGIFHG